MSAKAMGGRLNASSPDQSPRVWLCSSVGVTAPDTPAWMTTAEGQRLSRLAGAPRCDFLASRWLIRHALADVSSHNAEQCRPADGRPDASDQPPGWRLSVSHSGGMAGCAISHSTAIGLDIEPRTRRPQWRKVVNRWFTPEEKVWLLAGNNPDHFLRAWTLKEAWLKATGRGIANNLQTLQVSADFTLSGDRPGEHWRASLGLVTGFLVAVVYRNPQPPAGFTLPGQININNMTAVIPDTRPIDWLFHRNINPVSEPA